MQNNIINEEKIIIIQALTSYVNKRCNLHKYEEYIQDNFNGICKKGESNYYLNIINNFYMNEDEYKVFKECLNNNIIDKYISENYKKMLLINANYNYSYYINMNNSDIDENNYVKNGTLVFGINRVLDYRIDIKQRLMTMKKLDEYLKKIEEEMSTLLYVNVRILYHDSIIPPRLN